MEHKFLNFNHLPPPFVHTIKHGERRERREKREEKSTIETWRKATTNHSFYIGKNENC